MINSILIWICLLVDIIHSTNTNCCKIIWMFYEMECKLCSQFPAGKKKIKSIFNAEYTNKFDIRSLNSNASSIRFPFWFQFQSQSFESSTHFDGFQSKQIKINANIEFIAKQSLLLLISLPLNDWFATKKKKIFLLFDIDVCVITTTEQEKWKR